MPKLKKFNIEEFMDEASENVVPLQKSTTAKSESSTPRDSEPETVNEPSPINRQTAVEPKAYQSKESETENPMVNEETVIIVGNGANVGQGSTTTVPQTSAINPGLQNPTTVNPVLQNPTTVVQNNPATGYAPLSNGYASTAPAYYATNSAPKAQRGRKKSLRTIPRQNGKVIFLEIEADAALARISILQRVDKQDIIRTALDEFLRIHYDGNDLDARGSQMLTEYIQKTTQLTD